MGRKPNNKNTNLPKKSSIKKEETSLNLNDSANPSSPSNSIKLLPENKPKKKRGRKPKVLTEEELRIKNQPKIHKKRGRKPKEKFNFETSVLTYNKYENAENDSIIVKLPFTRNNINLSDNETINSKTNKDQISKVTTENSDINLNYNPNVNIPSPYDPAELEVTNGYSIIKGKSNINDQLENKIQTPKPNESSAIYEPFKETNNLKINSFLSNNNINQNININNKRQIDKILQNRFNKDNTIELLSQMATLNNHTKYPIKTDISCFWCCHNFDNIPWGMPMKYEDEKFHLFGIFCSPNCVASYIFNNYKSDFWEYYSLLNLLYFKIFGKIETILPAPDKICLDKFGGELSIEKYRQKLNNTSLYNIKFPPTISVIPVMEESNINSSINNNFIPIDTKRISKALETHTNELRLKRNKPINKKNTLDNCMILNKRTESSNQS